MSLSTQVRLGTHKSCVPLITSNEVITAHFLSHSTSFHLVTIRRVISSTGGSIRKQGSQPNHSVRGAKDY
jgi:hypothetical protein